MWSDSANSVGGAVNRLTAQQLFHSTPAGFNQANEINVPHVTTIICSITVIYESSSVLMMHSKLLER